ncbi:MAG: glycosyl transferase, partial [Spirochaetes bacterium]|nr:glycosyl transferase [Spirochaetota bacterium]
MKIVHILPGSGGTFYCDNCMRDISLAMELRKLGNEVIIVPMYLPLFADMPGLLCEMPVFYGAVNVYLKQKIPLFRRSMPWMETLLNSSVLMKFAARKAG